MASLRRNNNTTNDSQAKFLYAILKQLDHKSIDWNEVAAEIGITNGHAARMRFSRFKQHMDGTVPGTRKPRETHQQKKAKVQKKGKKDEDTGDSKADVKVEAISGDGASDEPAGGKEFAAIKAEDGVDEEEVYVKSEPGIKEEDTSEERYYSGSYDGQNHGFNGYY